jgi:hypothetical protein
MQMLETSVQDAEPTPYKPLRDDPKFDRIRALIKEFPSEKLVDLKKYIKSLEETS